MKSSVSIACAVLLIAPFVACDKKEAPAPEASAAQTASAAPVPAPAPPPPVTVAVDSIPAEEQYESEVEKEVTPANFEQKLDALDKELSAEK